MSRSGPFPGSITIHENPVTTGYRYNLTLDPSPGVGQAGFVQFTKEERADGGYHKASFSVRGTRSFLSEFYRDSLGRMAEINEPGGRTVWEGYINELAYDTGNHTSRKSLSLMSNKVWVRYREPGGTTTLRSTELSDTDSQDKYGTKEFVLSGGELQSLAIADQVAQTYLDLHKEPPEGPVQVSPGRRVSEDLQVEVKCLGFFSSLNWCTYNQTVDTDAQGSSAQITDIVGDSDVGQFILAVEIETNNSLVGKEFDTDRRGADIIKDLARMGDSKSNRWIAGMEGGRTFYFREAAPAVYPP